jgi:hypothetical protein
MVIITMVVEEEEQEEATMHTCKEQRHALLI